MQATYVNDHTHQPSKHVKDYKWYNSHSVPLELQIGILRLEIPLDISVNSDDIPRDISINAQIVCNQIMTHDAAISTHFAIVDEHRNSLVWDYVMSFPVKLKDISHNAVLVVTALTPSGRVIGGTSMRFFDDNGLLKQGKQKNIFYFGCRGDPNVIPQYNTTPGDLYDQYSDWDFGFRAEKQLELYKATLNASEQRANDHRLDWLDRLTLTQMQNTLNQALSRKCQVPALSLSQQRVVDRSDYDSTDNNFNDSNLDDYPWGRAYEEVDLRSYCCLIVELPQYPHPILFDDRTYSQVTTHIPPNHAATVAQGLWSEHPDTGVLEFVLNANRPFNSSCLSVIADWDLDQDNLSEAMHRQLVHDSLRGGSDPNIKPNLVEKEQIDRILQTAGNHTMDFNDRDVLYRFRYSLTENKKALTKFLLSLDWNEASEVAELPMLLSQWKAKAPIDVADALKLLGRERAFQHRLVREYAVETLQLASDDELLTFLLQLVQALRYEPALAESSSPTNAASAGASRRTGSMSVPVGVSPSQNQPSSSSNSSNSMRNLSPLANFLMSRGFKSAVVANYLYWYLKVETEDEQSGALFQEIFDTFLVQLSSSGAEGIHVARQLEAQDDYLAKISSCQKDARELGKRREGKETYLRKFLQERNLAVIPTKGVTSIPMPLGPHMQLTGLKPATATMFASAIYPCVIEFTVLQTLTSGDATTTTAAAAAAAVSEDSGKSGAVKSKQASTAPPYPPRTHKLMFKSGDDLRQDQLIMQMIALMDSLLKKVNLDLKLLTYGILAVGQSDGLMEFVTESMAVSSVQKHYNNSLASYLRHHNPDESGPYGIAPVVFDAFVKSCAGYCVITYILGIGDRHLDNIMIRQTGQLFHIDFGFIFGQDPKPLPPPFRLTRSMVDCMGGEDSEHYARFKSYCCQAYNWLRKSANLILNLLSLMGDAGINDISKRSDLPKVLSKVEEKFRLDLTDEEAEQYFVGLISESLNALAPKIMEVLHKAAVSMR